MMATINLFLDTRRAKAHGSFPLKLSVSHELKMRYVSLDVAMRRKTGYDKMMEVSWAQAYFLPFDRVL